MSTVLVGLLWGLASAQQAPSPFEEEGAETEATEPTVIDLGQTPADILERARSVSHLPLAERMDTVSQSLLGRPYLSDPLGEGAGIDADPFARYDVFDCLTYVEEVLALSLAGDPSHAAGIRTRLRYGDATPTYTSRRHFMELQWIPANIEDGWMRDATADYGETVDLTREWTLAGWQEWGRRNLFHHTDDELPVGKMSLRVLPLETALQVADQIRPGSILLTVREDRPWVPLWVTHVGLVFHDEGKPVVRHATKMGQGLVRDHSLIWYLEHIGTYSNWKTLGVAILEPIPMGPRVSRHPVPSPDAPAP